MSALTRRQFAAGASALAARIPGPLFGAVALLGGAPRPGNAQGIAELAFLKLGISALSTAANLFDLVANRSVRQSAIDGITKDAATLAAQQEEILGELEKIRIVLREELRRAFRNNDSLALRTEIVDVQDRLMLNHAPVNKQWLEKKAGALNRLCYKLGSYDAAAFPAFCAGAALQYVIHDMLGSSSLAVREITHQHEAALDRWLEDTGTGSIASLIDKSGSELAPHREFTEAKSKEYLLSEVVRVSSDWVYEVKQYWLSYEGIAPDGTPLLVRSETTARYKYGESSIPSRYYFRTSGLHFYRCLLDKDATNALGIAICDKDDDFVRNSNESTLFEHNESINRRISELYSQRLRERIRLQRIYDGVQRLKDSIIAARQSVEQIEAKMNSHIDAGDGAKRRPMCRNYLVVGESCL